MNKQAKRAITMFLLKHDFALLHNFNTWIMELRDGAKSCSWSNFVMALQACLSLFWRSGGRGGKKVYPVRAQPAMHARLAFPSPYRNICIIKGEESSHHSQPLLLPIHPREIQGDMIEQEGTRIHRPSGLHTHFRS